MIEALRIHNFRNLDEIRLQLGGCNVFVGANGSGKTSLLEAVFLLSRGKSFRHHEPKRYITHTKLSTTIWAKTTNGVLSLQKTLSDGTATTLLKINGNTAKNQSLLSHQLPVCVLDPSGMTLLEEGSQTRRQLLDWLVFHMKPAFYETWLAHERLLRQRNLLLKSPAIHQRLNELHAWDYQLSQYAQKLHEYRQAVFERWQDYFKVMLGHFLPKYAGQMTLSYQAGFNETLGLAVILKERLVLDIEMGYTRIGAHRSDVLVAFRSGQGHKEQAVNVLSRGEKKLLICALKLAQLQLLCDEGRTPVILIDDIDAELDKVAINTLLAMLLKLPCQLFITSLSDDIMGVIDEFQKTAHDKTMTVFDVKDGNITARPF